MFAKQLSVFIENRHGRLGEVLDVLKKNKVNILSLSLADTTEYGLLRLIVDNPRLGKQKLHDAGFSTMLSDVLVIRIDHTIGSLQTLLELLSIKEINIEYMYGLSIEGETATVVIKVSNSSEVLKIFSENNISTLSEEEIYKLK